MDVSDVYLWSSQPNLCWSRSLAPFHFWLVPYWNHVPPIVGCSSGCLSCENLKRNHICFSEEMLDYRINRFQHSDGGPVASMHLSCLVYIHSFKMFVMFIHWHRCVDASISQVSPFTLHRPHPETHKISQNHPTLSYPSACLTKSYHIFPPFSIAKQDAHATLATLGHYYGLTYLKCWCQMAPTHSGRNDHRELKWTTKLRHERSLCRDILNL